MSRKKRRWTGAILVALLMLVVVPAMVAAQDQVILDWETDASGNPIDTGQVIDDEYHTSTGVSVTVTVVSPHNIAAIFPSDSPPTRSGGAPIDPDLGSPNETCPGGGPGVGEDGEFGDPGQNCMNHENVLILPTIPDSNGDGFIDGNPDDDARGGTITLLFSEEVIIDYAEMLDQESEEALTINAYADTAGTVLLVSESPAGFGDNSYEQILLNAQGARRVDFVFAGSGAIASVAYTPFEPTAVNLSGITAAPASLLPALLAVAFLAIFTVALLALRQSYRR